jgi:hypothetical protein
MDNIDIKTLKDILNRYVLMDQLEKENFLSLFETFSQEKQERVIDFFSGMLHMQESFLEKNPGLTKNITHAAKIGFQKIIKNRESFVNLSELDELKQMEQDFLNL